MIKYKNPAPNNIAYEIYSDGTVKQGYLDGSPKIVNIKYCTEIAFWPSGKVRVGRIDGSAEVIGIICSGFIYFYPGGKIMSFKPVDISTVKGVTFSKGQYIDFDKSGNPVAGHSAKEQIIKGLRIPEETFFTIDESGKPEIIKKEDFTGDWRSTVDGMNYECGLTLDGFTCGGYSGGGRFGEWGTSCTIREFLQGDLQDFPLSYMNDKFPEIIGLAEKIHKQISSVEIYKYTIKKMESVPVVEKGKHLKNFSWNEGYDAEYEYSIDVYENCIVWHLEFDQQWSDPPRDAIQEITDFVKNGPPSDFGNSSNCIEIITYVNNLIN